MGEDLAEHHLKNVGERETHRVDPGHVQRFRDPDRLDRLRPPELVKNLNILEGDYVLEIGCGDGVFLEVLAEEVGQQGRVIGVDIEPEMVELARQNIENQSLSNVEVKQSENDSIPLKDGTVDKTLLVNTLHEMAYPSRTLTELYRVLRPGGEVLLFDRHKEETGDEGPPKHHLVSEQEAIDLFKEAGFERKREFEWDPDMYSIILGKL
ncbi:MAG: class I SAM-dependent methyltransferase [bacterium]